MTMDYQHPYNNFYPEYYSPVYQGTGYQYPQQHRQPQLPHQQHQHYVDQQSPTGPLRNFNNNLTRPPAQPQHHHLSQQRPQSYLPSFQEHTQHQQFTQQHSNYSTPYLPNFLVSSGTGLPSTLTPTSLATIEQSFLELQSAQQTRGWDSVTQSGFVPPVIDAGHSTEVSQDSQDYSSEYSDSEWEPKAKRGRDMKDIRNVNLIVTSNGTINAAPQRKYTRRNKDEKLPPEEEERRQVRRERNKLAAAKCRQRRVDHTNILVLETEKLEAEQSQLESEIQSLQQEKDQLEFILQAHQPLCQVGQSRSSLSSKVKAEPGSHPSSCGNSNLRSHGTFSPMPENLSISASSLASSVASNTVSSSTASSSNSLPQGASESSVFNSRPNSLPLIKRDRAHMLSSVAGITINTPTSGMTITPSSLFCPDLDSMVDGSTGLTPLTGMSCSSQVQRNSNEGGSETESTLISL